MGLLVSGLTGGVPGHSSGELGYCRFATSSSPSGLTSHGPAFGIPRSMPGRPSPRLLSRLRDHDAGLVTQPADPAGRSGARLLAKVLVGR